MPIGFFNTQPAANSILAAYRPIVYRVRATNTDGNPIPPVVFCDIYFDGVYYRSISKTQYLSTNNAYSVWEFDIQDAVKEYLSKFLPPNGGSDVLEAIPLITRIFCKFRSSGYNIEGFIITEDIAPIQGTSNTTPTPGTGTLSNTAFGINATLQHEDNQELSLHLDSFKNRDWADGTYPLTHRPDRYFVCKEDSDYFPIVTDKIVASLVLYYMPKGSNAYLNTGGGLACLPIEENDSNIPAATIANPYHGFISFFGSAPFTITSATGPSWMTFTIVDNTVVLGGTPDAAATIAIHVVITNCCGDNEYDFHGSVTTIACAPVEITDYELPDAIVGVPYSFVATLTGSSPFILDASTKPDWMLISIVGSTVEFSGTPPIGTSPENDLPVSIIVSNCGGATDDNAQLINLLSTQIPEGIARVLPCISTGTILDVQFEGVDIPVSTGAFPIISNEQVGFTPSATGTGTIAVKAAGTFVSLKLIDSEGNVTCLPSIGDALYLFYGVVIGLAKGIVIQMECDVCGATSGNDFHSSSTKIFVCTSLSPETLYWSGVFGTGVIMYTDAGHTTPRLGRKFIRRQSDGIIYNMNQFTGQVLSSTLTTC